MQTKASNKQITKAEDKGAAPAERAYCFPEHGITITAGSYDEALSMLEARRQESEADNK